MRSAILAILAAVAMLPLAGCPAQAAGPGPGPGVVAAPVLAPGPGTYNADQAVAITCATAGATIHVTTDGTAPTPASPAYTGPISVAGDGTTMTIRAMATAPGMTDSVEASAAYRLNYRFLYQQEPAPAGGLIASSFVSPGGTDADAYAYDSFVLGASDSIKEVRWRGGYSAGAAYGRATDFWITFYASTANDTQPLANNPHLAETYLAHHVVGGNAGETTAGTVGGVAMYDYAFVLPTPFAATANTKYWLRIEAVQGTYPDWSIAKAVDRGGTYYRFLVGSMMFATVPGDTAFLLLR